MWSTAISAEYCALPASRIYSRGDCFLYGYYNSEQPLIQVKICTAVDKEKSDCGYFNWNTYAPYIECSILDKLT